EPERAEEQARGERGQQNGAQNAEPGRCARGRARDDDALLALCAHPDRQNREEYGPPDHNVDGDGEGHAHALACSSSTSVPLKSLGCRNRTGLPWAPVLGSPPPSTRAPAARRLLRAAKMSPTS